MRPLRRIRACQAGFLLLGWLSCACAGESSRAQAGGGERAEGAAPGDAVLDGRIAELRAALEAGHLDRARALSEQLGTRDVETRLLAARTAAMGGDDLRASRLVEEARAASRRDARVYAAAAEIHAAAGRLDTADSEIRRGLDACGVSPELERARGVWLICQAGGARAGLELLEAALDHDPTLAFVHRPLGQAHLLIAKECARADDLIGAFEHAELSVEHDPDDVDGRRFLAEIKTQVFDFGGALALYEELLAEGRPLQVQAAQTYKSAAVAAMAQGLREEALLYFARARHLGMGDEELGSGVGILRDVARARLDEAWRASWRAGPGRAAGQGDPVDPGDPGDAGRACEKVRALVADALTHDPGIADDVLERARLAWRGQDLEAVRGALGRLELLDPGDARARVLACLVGVRETLAAGSLEQARERLRRDAPEPALDPLLAAESAWLAGLAAAEDGEADQARELHRAALAHDPDHARARAALVDLDLEAGVRALREGRPEDARESLRAALAADPTRIDARHFLAQALFDLGSFAAAVDEWQVVQAEARAGGLELPEPVHVHLARAQFCAGDERASRETLEDYLATQPEGAWVEQTRGVLEALPIGAESDGR